MKTSFFFLVLSFIGFVSCMVFNRNHYHRIFSKHDNNENTQNDHRNNRLNDKNVNSKIKNAQDLFICLADRCYSIQEYRILPENTFSCHEKNILVELLTLKNYNITDKAIEGYLTQTRTIVASQEISTICQIVKRYDY